MYLYCVYLCQMKIKKITKKKYKKKKNPNQQTMPDNNQLNCEENRGAEQTKSDENNSDTDTDSEVDIDPNETDIDVESEINLKTILLDIRKDVKQINHKFGTMKKSIKDLKKSNKLLQRQNDDLTKTVSDLKDQVDNLETTVQKNTNANERMEAQARRSNLIFYGIQGDKKESWETSEEKLQEYLTDELHINESRIQTKRVHRLKTKSSPAPIIAKFSFFKDRDAVLKQYRQKRKYERELASAEGVANGDTDQTPETVRVGEDFPVRVRDERKKTRAILEEMSF